LYYPESRFATSAGKNTDFDIFLETSCRRKYRKKRHLIQRSRRDQKEKKCCPKIKIQIQRLQVHSDCASLRRHHTTIIQEVYVEYRDEGKDVKEEESLVLKDEIYRQEVMDKLFESLQLIEDYEESCHRSRIW
jgi:hypothetical protein